MYSQKHRLRAAVCRSAAKHNLFACWSISTTTIHTQLFIDCLEESQPSSLCEKCRDGTQHQHLRGVHTRPDQSSLKMDLIVEVAPH
jgi:hypothetical protein